MATIEDLKQEVERLTRELDLATSEINQSAKYGLGLLDEKQTLQAKCEELENLYENSRHELEITQEVSNFFTCFLRFSVKALGSVGRKCLAGLCLRLWVKLHHWKSCWALKSFLSSFLD